MNNTKQVLDKGFVRLLNISGAVVRYPTVGDYLDENNNITDECQTPFSARDTDPAKCARICFANFEEGRTEVQDLKLVEYLMAHHHNTPVEMTETWWEMKLPIFIARQFVRHRTACINEVSARYTTLPADWYIPKTVGGKSTNGAKQGQEDNLTHLEQVVFVTQLDEHCKQGYKLYSEAIEAGVAPEHARLYLSVNHYTHWLWKMDLHNLMHFLALRLDKHAQVEARAYAEAMYGLLAQHLPETMKLFDQYRRLA